jgi:hypothetical protein
MVFTAKCCDQGNEHSCRENRYDACLDLERIILDTSWLLARIVGASVLRCSRTFPTTTHTL